MRSLTLSGGSILFFGEAMARLAAYLIGQLSLQGKSVILIDAAQAFDPYLVARMGRLLGTPPPERSWNGSVSAGPLPAIK
jgi:hypothetical protein